MGGLVLGLLVGYIVGGVSFIPLLIWGLWTWGTRNPSSNQAYKSRQAYASQDLPEREVDDDLGEWGAGLGEDLLRELKAKHVPDVASGYFAICREYVPGGVNGKPPDRNTAATNTMLAMESPSVYQSMYRSIFDRSRNSGPTLSPSPTPSKNKKTRNVFYVVLRLGHLMLYDDAAQLEVRHVISLVHYSISVYAGGEEIPEGELWIKRNCIRLIPRDSASAVGDARSFYFFSDNCSEKEDFYHAMLRSQESQFHPGPSSTPPPPLKFNPADLIKLVQQLHASEENLHTRWINALIGRLFLALYKTAHIENYIRNKVTKKIDRVQKPSLIRSIKVQKLDMGDLPPFLTNPKLKELTVDGDLTVEADVSYKGNFRIDISAVARIELGSRFKPREVTFILATILKSLEGHVLIRIKPPPSNRLWVTFETPPKMELSLEPIVSSRQITYGVILRAIESRIREVVNETLVFPNWDDMPFSSTHSHLFRGGIWEDEASLGQESHAPPGLMTVSTPEDVHAETRSIPDTIYSSSNESTKSMPALGSSALRQRKPVPSGAIEQNSSTAYGGRMGNSEPASAHYKLTSPRHSSSTYADLAIPTVDTDMAYSDHILMKTPTAGSPPPSPPRPDSESPQSPLDPDHDIDQPVHSAMSVTVARQRSSDLTVSPDENLASTTDSIRTEQRSEPTSVQKRTTLNQSLNSATTAAKKWLATRQNANLGGSAGGNTNSSERTKGEFLDVAHAHSGPKSEHHIGPIGRGQPLPPPGTPLPRPPRPDRRGTWGAQTASALANLARRAPLGTKTSVAPSASASSLSTNGSSTDLGEPDAQGTDASTALDVASPTMPPPLPKRRQRTSLVGSTRDRSGAEKVFVVEAPSQEVSAPSSPSADRASASRVEYM